MIKDAAALILLRDSDNGMEVCMLRRVETSGFAAGAYVFPGGAVDEHDKQLGETEFCLAKEETDSLLQANKVAAIRETLEEAGILASTNQNGIQIDDLLRHKLHEGEISFEDVLREHRVFINLDEVIFYDHWLTPAGAPKRFNTRFFLAVASADQYIKHDNKETDSSCWALPKEIISLYEQGEVKLMPVTHVQLKRLSSFDCVADILATAKKQTHISVTEPMMNYGSDGQPVSVTINLSEGVVEYPVFKKRT